MAPYWTTKIEDESRAVGLIVAQSTTSLIFYFHSVLETFFDFRYFWICSTELSDLNSNSYPSLAMCLHFLIDCSLMEHGIIVDLSSHHREDPQQVKHLQFFKTIFLVKFSASQFLCLKSRPEQLCLLLRGTLIAFDLEQSSASCYSGYRL